MELIEVNSYTENEKYHIAKDYLIPKQLEKNGLSKEQLNITGSALEKMIHGAYTREAGVRNLERQVGDICRKADQRGAGEEETVDPRDRAESGSLSGTRESLLRSRPEMRSTGRYRARSGVDERRRRYTESRSMSCRAKASFYQMTGQMGVMKRSAQIALTYVRSVASDYVKSGFEKHDIHLHIPEGAVPKDGPSAGITMATAMLSAVTGRKVLPRVAMTGEVTARGLC